MFPTVYMRRSSLPLFLVLVVLFAHTLVNHVVISFYCTDAFCEEQTASYASPCQPVKNCTKIGFRTFLDPDKCNCCEYCFDYLEEDDICEVFTATKPIAMCGPHLTCVRGERETDPATCQTMIAAPGSQNVPDVKDKYCMSRRYHYNKARDDGSLKIAQIYPECDASGFYAPRQCLPGSVCYCSDLQGNRIFGLATPQQYQDCACARDISRLSDEFKFTGRFPHCLPNGDYDELQCIVRTCYCRSNPDEKFPMHLMNETKCFNPEIHIFDPETPRYYMRDCELLRARIEVQIADAEMEGKKRIVADMPQCSPDGNYAPVQSEFNQLICAHPSDGSQIDNYGAEKFTDAAKRMDCHCARVRALLSNSATGKPRCCSNGSYRPWQCVGTKCFCVDRLGRQISWLDEQHENSVWKLPCYHGEEDSHDPPCDYTRPYADEDTSL